MGWTSAIWAQSYNNRTNILAPVALYPWPKGGTNGTAYGMYVDAARVSTDNWRVGDFIVLTEQCYAAIAVYDAGHRASYYSENITYPRDWGWSNHTCDPSTGCVETTPVEQVPTYRALLVPTNSYAFKWLYINDLSIVMTNGWAMRSRFQLPAGTSFQIKIWPSFVQVVSLNVTQSNPAGTITITYANSATTTTTYTSSTDPTAWHSYEIDFGGNLVGMLNFDNEHVGRIYATTASPASTTVGIRFDGGGVLLNYIRLDLKETWTPTLTSTETDTATVLPTATPTASATSTRTATRTASLTPTRTTSLSETSTATDTRTASRSKTYTATPSATLTATETHTETRTGTRSVSATDTGTESDTRTTTLTRTVSDTRTETDTATVTRTASESMTQTRTENGTRWTHYNCRPCSACVVATFTLSSDLEDWSLAAFCAALRSTSYPALQNYVECETETCIVASAGSSVIELQFRLFSVSASDFLAALMQAVNDGSLSAALARFLLGAVLDATYSLNATYSVDVNASVANRFPDAPWPWAGTSSKFVITMNTNRPFDQNAWSGLMTNGWFMVMFPLGFTFNPTLSNVNLTINCVGSCSNWAGVTIPYDPVRFTIRNSLLKVDLGLGSQILPVNIWKGDTLVVTFPVGVVYLPPTCTQFPHWWYVIKTGFNNETVNSFVGYSANDFCVDECNACVFAYELDGVAQWRCRVSDATLGWVEYTRPEGPPQCGRCEAGVTKTDC
eukprot:EG_transcript_166